MADELARDQRRGPTYSLFASTPRGSVLVLAGWRVRHARWEGRFSSPLVVLENFPGEVGASGDLDVLKDLGQAEFEFEALADDESTAASRLIADELLGKPTSAAIWESAQTIGKEPYSTNRDLDIGEALHDAGYEATDFLLCTLPTRRGVVGAPLFFGARWVRCYVGERGIVTIAQSPPTGHWDDTLVRWQHHALHSRSEDWFSRETAPNSPERRFQLLVDDLIRHQRYFARTWSAELELWEQRVYQALADGARSVSNAQVSSIEQELGHLAGYLAQAKIANRNLERRAEVSSLVRRIPGLSDRLAAASNDLNELYESDRSKLRSAMLLLNTLVNSAQARASEAQEQASSRTQHTITVVTTLFLAPSLVIGIYGANLRELEAGAAGSLSNLFLWLLAVLGVSWSGLRALERREVIPGRWWRPLSVLALYAATLTALTTVGPGYVGGAVLSASAFAITLTLTLVTRLESRSS